LMLLNFDPASSALPYKLKFLSVISNQHHYRRILCDRVPVGTSKRLL
jgi:hypothetical protein